MTARTHLLKLPSEDDTAALAAAMAERVRPGDVLLLKGEIGAGKSAFARALIRARAGTEIDVPSPTFTLVQTYDLPGLEIWHCDLFRLSHADEVMELGLDAAFGTALCLIEWPERMGEALPPEALTLHFSAEADGHTVRFTPNSAWADRLAGLDD